MRIRGPIGQIVVLLTATTTALPGFAQPPAQSNPERITRIAPLLKSADDIATRWQNDAELVAIFASTEPDGSIDLKHLVAPPASFHGGQLTLQFYSASANQELGVALLSSGQLQAMSPLPVGQVKPSLPASFIDLDQALEQARKSGLKSPPKNGRNALDVRLMAVRNEVDGKVRAAWTITPLTWKQPTFPTPGDAITLAADSGKTTRPADLSGAEEMEARLKSLEDGRPLSEDTPHNFAGFRAEADKWAELWNPQAALYQAEVLVSYQQQKLKLSAGRFRYCNPSAETAEVFVDKGGVKVSSFTNPVGVGAFFPRAVPQDVMPIDEAVDKLWKMKLGVSPEQFVLVLFHSGVTEPNYPISQDLSQVPTAAEYANRWLWRAVAMRDELIVSGVFRGRRSVAQFVYVPAEKAPPPEKAIVDRSCVGIWQMVVPTQFGSGIDWYLRIDSDGTYAFAPSGPGSASVHSGTIEIADGRWKLTSKTSDWTDGGTYRRDDPDALQMTGKLGEGQWQRRSPVTKTTN